MAKFISDNHERYNMHWSESLSSQELKITGKEALNLVKGLSSITSFKILQLLSKENLDVSSIAHRMKFSEAHISGEISRLEDLQLVKISYAPGKRGIRKVCMLAVKQISLII
jgi:predicted transcriptional regulator